MPEDRQALRDLAERLALEAAELGRRRRAEGVSVADTKSSDTDVVTETDREVEQLLRDRLAELRPGDGFVGEEGSDLAPADADGVSWVVDPIDGTVNFLYGIPQYAVSVAAQVGGRSVAGVVVDVTKGEVFTATRGGGAWLDGPHGRRRLEVRAAPPMAERLVLTGFSYQQPVRALQARAMAVLLPEVRDIRRFGSAALDLCAVAAGRGDGYVEEGLHPWDGAAGGLVAEEAGARLVVLPGAGGMDCYVCSPAEGFDDFLGLVRRSGLLREQNGDPSR